MHVPEFAPPVSSGRAFVDAMPCVRGLAYAFSTHSCHHIHKTTMTHPLFEAIEAKNLAGFRDLLNAELAKPDGVSLVESLRDGGDSLATRIAQRGHVPMMKLLADARCGLGAPESRHMAPLHFAAERGDQRMVAFLLKNAHLGIHIDAPSTLGETAAHLAAENGHVEILSSLQQHGAKMNLRDQKGNLPAHFAARGGRSAVIDFLNLGASPSLVAHNNLRDTPAHMVNAERGAEVIARLAFYKGLGAVTAENSDGNHPLHLAAISGDDKVVEALLKAGVAPDTPSRDGATAWIAAKQEGHQDVLLVLARHGVVGPPVLASGPVEKAQYQVLLEAAGASRVAGPAARQQGPVALKAPIDEKASHAPPIL